MKNKWRVATIVLSLALLGTLCMLFAQFFFTTTHPHLDPFEGVYDKTDLLVNLRPLRERLQALVEGQKITIYFEALNTGANVSINPNMAFFPGSLMKIPVAMATMKNVEDGVWTLDNKLVLTDADRNCNWGDLCKLPTGTEFTVRDLLVKLLVNSDDTARAIFLRNLGDAKINDVLDYLGLQDIFNKNLQINAQRYSNFFRALYKSSYLSESSSEYLLEVMDMPHDISLLRQGIPDTIDFSHKIGVYGTANSDAGIVYVPKRPYILTVMVDDPDSAKVRQYMGEISTMVYQYVTTKSLPN